MTAREAFSRQWSKGGRRLIAVSVLSLIGIAVANAVLLGVLFSPGEGPLHYTNPQKVLTPVVPYQGELVTVGTKCNDLDTGVPIASTQVFDRLDEGRFPRSVFFRNTAAVRVPGCETTEFRTTLPPTLPPGRWRLVGINVVVASTGERQTLSWYTEPFEVTP